MDLKRGVDRAIADFDLAIASDPTLAVAFYNRGSARSQKRDSEGALADYDRAIQLDPRLAEAHRGGIRYVTGDLTGAISDGSRAIELNLGWPLPGTIADWREWAKMIWQER